MLHPGAATASCRGDVTPSAAAAASAPLTAGTGRNPPWSPSERLRRRTECLVCGVLTPAALTVVLRGALLAVPPLGAQVSCTCRVRVRRRTECLVCYRYSHPRHCSSRAVHGWRFLRSARRSHARALRVRRRTEVPRLLGTNTRGTHYSRAVHCGPFLRSARRSHARAVRACDGGRSASSAGYSHPRHSL
jgi:hypothetical protein